MLDYMRKIRERLGHIPVVVSAASVLVINAQGQVLLQLRNDNGCWAYPGGAIDVDEAAEDTAIRELREETGLLARSLRLFGVYSGPDMHHVYPNGDEISNVDILYICEDYIGNPRPDGDESRCLQFFDIAALPDNISPPCVRALRDYVRASGKR